MLFFYFLDVFVFCLISLFKLHLYSPANQIFLLSKLLNEITIDLNEFIIFGLQLMV